MKQISISILQTALVAKDATTESAAILCRAVPAPLVAAGVMMFMPGGLNQIRCSQKGKPVEVQVLVDRAGATALEAQRAALIASGARPFFDFNHADEDASFWPEEFVWQDSPEPGIYCKGDWSDSGKSAVDGKRYRQFSPVFFVDDEKAKPARIICNLTAGPNMGGLVNKPAFKAILPLWAKEAGEIEAPNNRDREIADLHREAKKLLAATKETPRLIFRFARSGKARRTSRGNKPKPTKLENETDHSGRSPGE